MAKVPPAAQGKRKTSPGPERVPAPEEAALFEEEAGEAGPAARDVSVQFPSLGSACDSEASPSPARVWKLPVKADDRPPGEATPATGEARPAEQVPQAAGCSSRNTKRSSTRLLGTG